MGWPLHPIYSRGVGEGELSWVMELGVTTQTHLAGPSPSVGNAEQLEAVNFSAETDAAGKEMQNSATGG